MDLHKPFWSEGGRFMRYQPEFLIAIFNQILLLVVVLLTFLVARKIFDAPAGVAGGAAGAWLGLAVEIQRVRFADPFAAGDFSGAGLVPGGGGRLGPRRKSEPAPAVPVCVGHRAAGRGGDMLTRYSFGWVMVPVILYFAIVWRDTADWLGGGGVSGLCRGGVAVDCAQPCGERHVFRHGRLRGGGRDVRLSRLATDAVVESRPDFGLLGKPLPGQIAGKTAHHFVQDDVLRLGGGWMAVLFLAGLLLGLRNVVARRLRYFTMMCLGVFILVSALGRTQWTAMSPELNTENPLVLLTPLVVIFGVAFFLTLLEPDERPVGAVPLRRHRAGGRAGVPAVHHDPAAAKTFAGGISALLSAGNPEIQRLDAAG